MKLVHLVATCALIVLSTTASAQFVKGNEAVKVMPDGSKKAETPSLPAMALAQPCPATRAGCAGGGWKMIETAQGLQECTEFYARATTCRASTYGTEKLSRVWVVKLHDEWKQCQFPDISKACVSTKDLPLRAVQ